MNEPTSPRYSWTLVASFAVLLVHSPSLAASMCHADKAASASLGVVTAKASARFLEAASQAFLAFKALEEGSDAASTHSQNARSSLDEAISAYKVALELSADVAQADTFLRQREFERLQRVLGITSGTLSHTRWELFARTAQTSPSPAADLIRVCVAGAESLKVVMASVKPGIRPVQVRRAAYNWHLVLMHGSLVSDAFDASVR